MNWKPKNKEFSDIFWRLYANLPLTGSSCREQLIITNLVKISFEGQ